MLGSKIKVSTASDEVLAKLVGQRNRAAMEELYDRYFDLLFRFSYSYVKNEAMAEDIVQDLFVDLVKLADGFDPKKRFKTWVLTVTANRCKNTIRNLENRKRISVNLSNQSSLNEPYENRIDAQILKTEIHQFIQQCSKKEQELYHLRFEMDMSIREIATTLDLPEGSVKSGLFYLLKKIRNPLKNISNELR